MNTTLVWALIACALLSPRLAEASVNSCPNTTRNPFGVTIEGVDCNGNEVIDGGTLTLVASDGGIAILLNKTGLTFPDGTTLTSAAGLSGLGLADGGFGSSCPFAVFSNTGTPLWVDCSGNVTALGSITSGGAAFYGSGGFGDLCSNQGAEPGIGCSGSASTFGPFAYDDAGTTYGGSDLGGKLVYVDGGGYFEGFEVALAGSPSATSSAAGDFRTSPIADGGGGFCLINEAFSQISCMQGDGRFTGTKYGVGPFDAALVGQLPAGLSLMPDGGNQLPCEVTLTGKNDGGSWIGFDCLGNEYLSNGYTAWEGNPDGGPGTSINWQGITFGDGTTLDTLADIFLNADGGPSSMYVFPESTDGGLAQVAVNGTVTVSGTATVSGTVTANQGAAAVEGTPPWPVATQATDGGFPITELTDGTNLLATSSHPLRIDPTGSTTQPVSGAVTVSGTVTATQGGTWNLGTVSDGGALAVTQQGAPWSSSITTISDGGPLAVSQSGSWSATVSGTVAATQSGTWNVGTISDGGQLVVGGAGLAGMPNGGVLSVQGVTNGVGLNVVNAGGTVTIADGGGLSVNATQVGTWNVGTISDGGPLAVSQSGIWNVGTLADGGPLAVSESGTWNIGTLADGGPLAVTQSGTWNVGTISDGGVLGVLGPDTVTSATALGAANATVSIAMAGQNSVSFNLTAGTLAGTLHALFSLDNGATYTQTDFISPLTGNLLGFLNSTSGVGQNYGIFIPAGTSNVEVTVFLYTSGTSNGSLRATAATPTLQLAGLSDGTSGPAAIKASSTAAVATDPALVVSISPNTTVNDNVGTIADAGALQVNLTLLQDGGYPQIQPTQPADLVFNGSLGALNAVTSINCNGLSTVVIEVESTFSGTVSFLASADGLSFEAIQCMAGLPGFIDGLVKNTTGGGIFTCNVGGLKQLQAKMTSYVSGAATIEFEGSTAIPNINSVVITDTIQGPAAIVSSGGQLALNTAATIVDSTGNNQAHVTPASTAAVSSNTSLVVAVNPNTPVNIGVIEDGGALTVSGTVTVIADGGALAITGPQANNAAITANPILGGSVAVAVGNAPGTVAAAGNIISGVADLYGDQYVVLGSPNHGTAHYTDLSTSLTQQIAAPASGTHIYLTIFTASSVTAATTLELEYGTGSNCASGTTEIFEVPTTIFTSAAPTIVNLTDFGIQIPAANAVCAVCGSATDTCDGWITYYIAN